MRIAGLYLMFVATFATYAQTPEVDVITRQSGFDLEASKSLGKTEAEHDIEAGRLKIYMAGGRASDAVGIPLSERHLITGLPRDNRLSHGCTDPLLQQHVAYAEAYNRVILQHLRHSHKMN